MVQVNHSFMGSVLQGERLTPDEHKILERDVFQILAFGSNFLQQAFQLNKANIRAACEIAKSALSKSFGGILSPDAEVGVSLLRPGHILRDTTTAETPINTWDSESIATGSFAAGNDYYVGYGSTNSTAVNISRNIAIIILGAFFTQGNAPVVSEMYASINEKSFPIINMRQAWLGDNPNRARGVLFPPIILEPQATVSMQVRSDYAGRQELQLLGLTFGKASYLRKQSYAAADLPG